MFSNNFNFELVANTISGPNSINKVYEFLKEKNYKKVGLILDKNLFKKSGYAKIFLKKIKKKKILKNILYFSGTSEPTYQYLDLVISKLRKKRNNKFDCLIAIGGGSTIDFAKGVATLLKNSGSALKYRGFPKKLNRSIPIIAIPSTSGTGSELAYNAVFTDLKSKKKLGINTRNNYPILSILDPKIPVNSPRNVILNSSLGALIRSIDSMFNKESNKISIMFSENAFKLLFNNLPKVLKNKNNLEYWSNMQWGAYLSIAALLNSSNGPGAVIAYYLSANYNIPQGLGYAISGISFFERNHKKGYYEYSKLFDLIEKKPNRRNLSKKEKSEFVIHSLLKIFKNNKLTLKTANIPKSQNAKILKFISKTPNKVSSNSVITSLISKNPIQLNKQDLTIIIKKILEK
jgi:alcohol dehydrogenase class IV